jgi:hypothetical protein
VQTGRQAADLRQAAVTLALIGRLTGDRDKPPLLALTVGLAALLEAVGDLRAIQDRRLHTRRRLPERLQRLPGGP